jgi:hypothetical protein
VRKRLEQRFRNKWNASQPQRHVQLPVWYARVKITVRTRNEQFITGQRAYRPMPAPYPHDWDDDLSVLALSEIERNDVDAWKAYCACGEHAPRKCSCGAQKNVTAWLHKVETDWGSDGTTFALYRPIRTQRKKELLVEHATRRRAKQQILRRPTDDLRALVIAQAKTCRTEYQDRLETLKAALASAHQRELKLGDGSSTFNLYSAKFLELSNNVEPVVRNVSFNLNPAYGGELLHAMSLHGAGYEQLRATRGIPVPSRASLDEISLVLRNPWHVLEEAARVTFISNEYLRLLVPRHLCVFQV